MQADKFCDTDATTWIDKHVPICISFSTILIEQPVFSCNSNHGDLVKSFVDALDGLATQIKALMKLKILEIETSVEGKLSHFFSALNQSRCRKEPVLEFEDECIEKDEEQDVSPQFLQTQKNQLIDLQDHLERYCNVFLVFGFNSAKYDISLIKSYLLLLFVNEQGFEPVVIRKAKQFVSFKF